MACRHKIFNVHRGRCWWCGHLLSPLEFTLDHVIPRARRGQNTQCNLVPSCMACNSAKADHVPFVPSQRMRLAIREGRRPQDLELAIKTRTPPFHNHRPPARGVLRSREEIVRWTEERGRLRHWGRSLRARARLEAQQWGRRRRSGCGYIA